MAVIKIKCIHCKSENVVKNGKRPNGIQCLKCKNCSKCFQECYTNNGAKPETKIMIVKMSINGSGIRDISRVFGVSQNTVFAVKKNKKRAREREPEVQKPQKTAKNKARRRRNVG